MARLTQSQRTMYAEFCEEFPFCFACRFQPIPFESFEHLGSILDCSHIVGGPGRKADRRCITRLCRYHHQIFDGAVFSPSRGITSTPITIENVVWLKQHFDPEFLDIDYLRSLRIKHNLPIIPEPLTNTDWK